MKLFARILLPALLLMSLKAQALSYDSGVLLGLNLLKYDLKNDGATIGTSESQNSYYDLKLGYTYPNRIYVGLIYSTYSNNSSHTRTAPGLTVGYHNMGYYIDLSYFLNPSYRYASGTSLKEGSGLALDFGYQQLMGSNFFLDLQLSYKSFSYAKVESGSTSTTQDNKQVSELYPMVGLGFLF